MGSLPEWGPCPTEALSGAANAWGHWAYPYMPCHAVCAFLTDFSRRYAPDHTRVHSVATSVTKSSSELL